MRYAAPAYITLGLLALLGALAPPPAAAEARHTIICGSGGDDNYRQKFAEWGARLHRALRDKLNVPEENLTLLREDLEAREGASPDAPALDAHAARIGKGRKADAVFTPATLENITAHFAKQRQQLTLEDDLYVYFIGHGSYQRDVSKFNIPGPDLTALAFSDLVDGLPARRLIVINSTSRSAPFIRSLSGFNRIICSATKSEREGNATEFMEYFIQGLEDGSADQNRDERISVLEACQQASILTAAAYVAEGILATEHALLDDNGDGLGSRLPIAQDAAPGGSREPRPRTDGALAAASFLQDYRFPASVPRALVNRYLGALDEVAALKLRKADLKTGEYYAALEALLLQAARANREIRTQDGGDAADGRRKNPTQANQFQLGPRP